MVSGYDDVRLQDTIIVTTQNARNSTQNAPISGWAVQWTTVKMARLTDKEHTLKDLDFSFLDITEVSDLQLDANQLEPREVGLKKEKPKKNAHGKYDTQIVRINNNRMDEVKDLLSTLEIITMNPEIITWVDLSFNILTVIDPCLCDLPSLQILYLHANCIAKLSEVDKLAGVPQLRKLSLHSNPMATDKFYKPYVLTRVKQLRCFDMAGITKADRATCNTLTRMSHSKKSRRIKGDE